MKNSEHARQGFTLARTIFDEVASEGIKQPAGVIERAFQKAGELLHVLTELDVPAEDATEIVEAVKDQIRARRLSYHYAAMN